MKYNDDTIFDNLEIFQDVGASNNKVHGSKDKFNAKSLLSTPIWEIPVSEDEDESPRAETLQVRASASSLPRLSQEVEETKDGATPVGKQPSSERSQQPQIRMLSGDVQELDGNSNNNVS